MTKKVTVRTRQVPGDGREPLKGAGPVNVTRDREVMAAINVRLPRQLFDWLNDQAAEEQVSVSQVVRNAIAAAIVRHGDHERYGIELVEGDES